MPRSSRNNLREEEKEERKKAERAHLLDNLQSAPHAKLQSFIVRDTAQCHEINCKL